MCWSFSLTQTRHTQNWLLTHKITPNKQTTGINEPVNRLGAIRTHRDSHSLHIHACWTGVGLWVCLVSSFYSYRWDRRTSEFTKSGLNSTRTYTQIHLCLLTATPGKGKSVTVNAVWCNAYMLNVICYSSWYTQKWTLHIFKPFWNQSFDLGSFWTHFSLIVVSV